MAKVERSDAEWRSVLSPERYQVLRKKGTEPPFTGGVRPDVRPGRPELFREEPSAYRAVAEEPGEYRRD